MATEAPQIPAPAGGGTPADAVQKAATDPSSLTDFEAVTATDWFLGDEEDDTPDTLSFELNVGGPRGSGREKWRMFTVKDVGREFIEKTRTELRRGDGTVDTMQANLRIAAAGLIVPNLKDPKILKQFADPADALRARFKKKSGLIDVIAGKVVTASGYDDDDVREVTAAGN